MEIMILLLLCIIAMIALYWIWVLRSNRNQPPTLPGFIPFIGHGYKFITDNSGEMNYLKEVAQFGYKNKGVVTMWLGTKPLYVIVDPEISSSIFKSFLERNLLAYKVGRAVLGLGIVTASVPLWKHHRKILNQTFNQQMLDEYTIAFNKQARRLVKELAKEVGSGPFDQLKYAKKNAYETVCLTALGIDITDASNLDMFAKKSDLLSNVMFERFWKVWLHNDFLFNLSSLKKTQDASLQNIHEISINVIRQRKEKLLHESRSHINGEAFTDEQVEDEVRTMVISGSDTIAIGFTTVLAMMASFPEVQNTVVAEIQRELINCNENFSIGDLSRLHFLEAVIKETLRLHTIVAFALRHIDKDFKTDHYTLKAGTDCIMILDAIHKHPSWGPDRYDFKPERWLNSATLHGPHDTSVSFGLGKRNCIGKPYAMLEMKIMLIHVLKNYIIKGNNEKIKYELGVVFKPVSGYQISIEHRLM